MISHLRSLKPGERAVYFTGEHSLDASPHVRRVVEELREAGKIHTFVRRLRRPSSVISGGSHSLFEYLAEGARSASNTKPATPET